MLNESYWRPLHNRVPHPPPSPSPLPVPSTNTNKNIMASLAFSQFLRCSSVVKKKETFPLLPPHPHMHTRTPWLRHRISVQQRPRGEEISKLPLAQDPKTVSRPLLLPLPADLPSQTSHRPHCTETLGMQPGLRNLPWLPAVLNSE